MFRRMVGVWLMAIWRRYVTTRAEVRSKHVELLKQYRHVRYMWFPYSDTVTVDVSNPMPAARRHDADVLTPAQVIVR